ncbi:hypothetical protein HNR01_002887 [Methylorubrum rhodesianum]|jgi:hypothetical protein|nr:hypothetical protein [Methylorubrum rhodesianum]
MSAGAGLRLRHLSLLGSACHDRLRRGGPNSRFVQGWLLLHGSLGRRKWLGTRSRPSGRCWHEGLRGRRPVAERALWTHRVGVSAPALDDDLCLPPCVEDLVVQKLAPPSCVAALDAAVLPWGIRCDAGRLTADCRRPGRHRTGEPVPRGRLSARPRPLFPAALAALVERCGPSARRARRSETSGTTTARVRDCGRNAATTYGRMASPRPAARGCGAVRLGAVTRFRSHHGLLGRFLIPATDSFRYA